MFVSQSDVKMLNTIAFRVLHYILALSSFIRQWFLRISALTYLKGNSSAILSDARNLKKLPLHMAFIFQEDTFSYNDIASAILWSVSMGISYISLYDTNGVLKRNEKLLYDTINKHRGSRVDLEQSKADICLHSTLGHKDTSIGISTINVFLLSLEDGRNSLVKVAKTLSQKVCEKHIKSIDITPDYVDQFLQEELHYPDPDLIVRFGHVESLLGFMPWQVRLTEILSLPTHKGLDYKTFKSILVSYGNTQQRFGK